MPPSAARRLVLVPAAPSPRDRPLGPGVRRFRLAQRGAKPGSLLPSGGRRLEPRELPRPERFAHLKHPHD